MAAGSKKVIYAALLGNLGVAVTKFIAAALTGSSAMISEGIHSLVDTGNQVLLLFGLSRAAKPPDAEFPFGHGKEIYFWSFVVAILIFAVGAGVSIYEGIMHLIDPSEMENPQLNYIILILAMMFEGASWWLACKELTRQKGRRSYFEAIRQAKDPSIFVVFFEDSAALLGLAIAFLGVLLTHVTGWTIFDGSASIVIGLILGCTAIWLARETKGLLIGESADRDVIEGIRRIVNEPDEVVHVNEVLTLHMGPEYILATISLDFADNMGVGQIENLIGRLDREIKALDRRVRKVFIEAESWSRISPARPPAVDAAS